MLKFILVKAPVFDGLLTALGDEYEIKVILDDHERAKFVAKTANASIRFSPTAPKE
jgi:hypothetical protein